MAGDPNDEDDTFKVQATKEVCYESGSTRKRL
jgi:hypothetical protein